MIQNPILLQKGGVDTSDATAAAENIDVGYSAYVNGEKIVGTSMKNADTSLDTVNSEALLEGYTAHDSSGCKINGSCTYNADTSEDNVSPECLLENCSAHDSGGNLIFGTLIQASLYNLSTSLVGYLGFDGEPSVSVSFDSDVQGCLSITGMSPQGEYIDLQIMLYL